MEKFYDYLERGCSFLGIVGFQNTSQPKVESTIKNLKLGQVKLCLLSSDDETKTLVTAFQSRLLSQDLQIFQMKSLEVDKLKYIIHEILGTFKKDLYGEEEASTTTRRSVKSSIREMRASQLRNLTENRALSAMKVSKNFKNYALLASSACLDVIFKDEYLMSHFSFIAYFCKCIIVYEITQPVKEGLLRVIRGFPENTNNLAIVSSSFVDTTLLRNTDISFMIDSDFPIENGPAAESNTASRLPDIVVNDYTSVIDFIFKRSRYIQPQLISIIVYIFYFNCVIGWCLFFLNIFTEFNASFIFDSFLIMVSTNIFLLVPVLLSLTMKEKDQDRLLDEIPYFMYSKRSSLIKAFVVGGLLDSVKDACILFFFLFFTRQLQDGNLLGYSETSGQLVVALFSLAISNVRR